jgi:hypothetical protein
MSAFAKNWRREVRGKFAGVDWLFSHAEPNHACCAAFGPGSLQGRANGRNKYLAIIARDSISRPFDVTQSGCLPRIAFRAWRSRRTGWTLGTRRS